MNEIPLCGHNLRDLSISTTLLMHKCFYLNQFCQSDLIFLSTLALDFQIKCQSLGASSELSWEMSRESKRLIRPGSCLWGHPVAKRCAIENNVYAVSLFTNCWLCTHILLESYNTQQKCLSKETYRTVSSYISSMCMLFLWITKMWVSYWRSTGSPSQFQSIFFCLLPNEHDPDVSGTFSSHCSVVYLNTSRMC